MNDSERIAAALGAFAAGWLRGIDTLMAKFQAEDEPMSDTTTGLTNRQIAERLGRPLREYYRIPFADGTYTTHERDISEYDFPNWTGSVDAALTLPLAEGTRLEITVYADGSAGVELLSDSPRGCKRAERGTTIAEKICEVWWAWQEAKGV